MSTGSGAALLRRLKNPRFESESGGAAVLELESATGIDGLPTRKLRFAGDSPLEGDGFEPSVPRAVDGILSSLAMRVLEAGR